MTNTAATINPMEYTFTPERIKVLEQYEARVNRFNNAEAMVRQNRAGRIQASEVYHALDSMIKYRDFHGITRREMTAFKSRNAVKCNSVAQAVDALLCMFSRKSEKAA